MRDNHLIILLIVAVAVARLLPHPFNFTPIGALAMFSGAYVRDKRFLLLPLIALLLGDAVNGLYALSVMMMVYLGFMAQTLISHRLLRLRVNLLRFVVTLVLGAITFYLVSNIGMWWYAYPLTAAGLIMCWVDGWPFLLSSMFGDLLYGSLMFGAVEWFKRNAQRQHHADGIAVQA